ncbi:MAG TPA: ribonuclease HII [Burkholderiales bacterium]|nr:ribonuclease HII [Burkholderiales bacterium]
MSLVCGVDEAGRGPLAGPVFAAAVILGRDRSIAGITDSKMLTAERREELAVQIRAGAVAWAVASASVEEIDSINILQASLLAMRRAVEALDSLPTEVLVDGLHCPPLKVPARAVVKGDLKIKAIGAASILAKVARDAAMLELHQVHPQYGFDRHKGYSTPEHLAALRAHGACAVHRRSFAPVRLVLGAVRPSE